MMVEEFAMAGPPLSKGTESRLEALFAKGDRQEAEALLIEECGNNLPLCKGKSECELERIRFATLRESEGSLKKLRSSIALAKLDWRDLLMAAGFGEDPSAHERWFPGRVAG